MSLVSSINSVKRNINPAIIIEDGALLIEAKKDGIFKFDSVNKSGKLRIKDTEVIVKKKNGKKRKYNLEKTTSLNSLVLLRVVEIFNLESSIYDMINMTKFFSRHNSKPSISTNKGLEDLRRDMYFFLDTDGLDFKNLDQYNTDFSGQIFTTLLPMKKLLNLIESNKTIISKSKKLKVCFLNPNLEIIEGSSFSPLSDDEKEFVLDNNIGINYLCYGDPESTDDEIIREPGRGVKGYLRQKLEERDYDEFMLRLLPLLSENMSADISNFIKPFNIKGNKTNQFSCYIKKAKNPYNKRHYPEEFKQRQMDNSANLKKILKKRDSESIQNQILSEQEYNLFTVDVKNNYVSWKNEAIPSSRLDRTKFLEVINRIPNHSSS